MSFVKLVVLAGLSGCAEFPNLDTAIAQRGTIGQFPVLVPIDPILLSVEIDTLDAQAQADLLAAGVAQLNARARAMRRVVIEPDIRARMAETLSRVGS